MKCLIVNDFGPIVDILKRLLYQIDSNVDITYADTSFDGIRYLNDSYDNILVDYSLPDGNIESFITKALQKKYNKRIIVLCMPDVVFNISKFIRSHNNTENIVFITKPFDKASLLNVLFRK